MIHERKCDCGRMVSPAEWEECNDLAYWCPYRDENDPEDEGEGEVMNPPGLPEGS